MRFEHDGKRYDITWKYDIATVPTYKKKVVYDTDMETLVKVPVFTEQRRITCILSEKVGDAPTDWEELVSAESGCHSTDRFIKEKGRKTTLTAALQDFPRDFRTKAWEAYNNRVN